MPPYRRHTARLSRFESVEEYRGFILDGGGHDWDGENSHTGGHTRLSPVYKELLVEVDAMTGVTNMPDRAGIATWMDAVARGISQNTDGAGFRMYYVIDDLATPHNLFTYVPGGDHTTALAREYVLSVDGGQRNDELDGFTHLQLIDSFDPSHDSAGHAWNTAAGAIYAVDTGHALAAADIWDIDGATYHPGYISHELHHAYNNTLLHFLDPNDNETNADGDDQGRVLWDYNFDVSDNAKSLTVAISDTGEVPTISLNNVTNLPQIGRVRIDDEYFRYTGITGNTLTGVTPGYGGTTRAEHNIDDAVLPQSYPAEGHHIRYGQGSVSKIKIEQK